MRTLSLLLMLAVVGTGSITQAELPASQPAEINGDKLDTASAPALVQALGDPSNAVRAQAADRLRAILAANPSAAPNWHDSTFWTQRIEKLKPGMLVKDALALLNPKLSDKERERLSSASTSPASTSPSDAGVGAFICLLDDYWQVPIEFKLDVNEDRLIDVPKLERFVHVKRVEPAGDYTGLWVTWHVNGQKAVETQYRNGQQEGTETSYYDDGRKSYQYHYKAGHLDGSYSGWYQNGKKIDEGQYKDGERDGTCRHWYENGQLNTQATYKNGNQEGSDTTWWENGQKQYEVHYQDGKKHGLDTAWDEHGKVLWQQMFSHGEKVESK